MHTCTAGSNGVKSATLTVGGSSDTWTITNAICVTDYLTDLPAVRSWTDSTSSASSTLTLRKPSGVINGELLLIIVGNDDNTKHRPME